MLHVGVFARATPPPSPPTLSLSPSPSRDARMQPPHLSCPSSSTSVHASSHILHVVHSLLSSAGFSKSSSQAIHLLTEVFERYLLLVASTSHHHSGHVGRRVATACDVERSLNELGTSTEDIQRWFEEEGGDVAGQWLSVEEEAEREESLGTIRRPRGESLSWSVKQVTYFGLPDLLNTGKVPASDRGDLIMHYQTVDAEQRAALEAILLTEDEESDEEEQIKPYEETPPPPYTSGRVDASPASVQSLSPTYKRRRLSTASVEYVPSFLPDFPVKDADAADRLTSVRDTDAEFEREVQRRVQLGEERSELLHEGAERGQGSREEQEAKAMMTLDLAPAPKRATEDNWQSAVDFSTSTLATQQTIDDIPDGIVADDDEEDGSRAVKAESSNRVFANDYLALVSEASATPPTLLTPTGSAHANAFNQRRGLATLLSDPSKYGPCDTIFAAIDVRPSAAPFQPGPSLLITPPTNSTSAPTFTPIRASGRELVSTSTMNNSLHPICKHRIPNNVLNSSRLLSGGTSGEIFRRVTRIHDPIPILDERHAERVFHGTQAPKEQLSESNSYLREALDVLKAKRAEEIRAGTLEEEESRLSLSTSRDKMRLKSGTLVQTWDWMSRDYTDTILPAKKFRNGTTGVFSSNSTEADSIRQRSESVYNT